ncbi:MAG: hypothetical protein DRP18_01395 [Candidatus Aenigmatarchaeota archaeon]|nr:MAG: hypothetical protein DRP18_01395 [Candidatus Aenigmarchaeota archaeon]
MNGFKILEAIVISLFLFYIVYLGHPIVEQQKITICQSCQEQNWTGELPAVDMKVNCSEVKGWCEEEVMVNEDNNLDIFNLIRKQKS